MSQTQLLTWSDGMVTFKLWLPCRKLSPRYVGPFKILHQINPVTYRIDLPTNNHISSFFHVSMLKLVCPTSDPLEPQIMNLHLLLDIDGAPMYMVKEIMDFRRRGGQMQYLVDWEGYRPEKRPVAAKDILDPSLIHDFQQAHHSAVCHTY